MSARTALFAGVGALAVIGLAACSSPSSTTTATAPVTTVTTAPATTTPATGAPATSPAPQPSHTVNSNGQGGGAVPGKPWYAKVNFAEETFRHMKCLPGQKQAEVFSGHYSDVTGDGRVDAVITAACPSETSQNPVFVFVFDGRDTKAPLTLAAKLATDNDYTKIAVRTRGRSISIDAEALSKKAALCCPDLHVTETWTYQGGHFARTAYHQTAL